MKHIKLFETTAERNNVVLETPYVAYIKETDIFESLDEQPVEKRINPELMALCYSMGWCVREDYMTAEECSSVSNTQFNVLTAELLKNVVSLDELKYFTGLTKFPKIGLFTSASKLETIRFPNSMVEGWTSSNGTIFNGCTKLKKVVFPDNVTAYCGTGTDNQSICKNVSALKFVDLSNTKLKAFGSQAFATGVALTGLTLPETMSSLNSAWYYGTAMRWIKLLNPTPIANLRASSNRAISGSTRIYVPDESVDAYKNSSVLSAVAANVYPISQWQEDVDNGVIAA